MSSGFLGMLVKVRIRFGFLWSCQYERSGVRSGLPFQGGQEAWSVQKLQGRELRQLPDHRLGGQCGWSGPKERWDGKVQRARSQRASFHVKVTFSADDKEPLENVSRRPCLSPEALAYCPLFVPGPMLLECAALMCSSWAPEDFSLFTCSAFSPLTLFSFTSALHLKSETLLTLNVVVT